MTHLGSSHRVPWKNTSNKSSINLKIGYRLSNTPIRLVKLYSEMQRQWFSVAPCAISCAVHRRQSACQPWRSVHPKTPVLTTNTQTFHTPPLVYLAFTLYFVYFVLINIFIETTDSLP